MLAVVVASLVTMVGPAAAQRCQACLAVTPPPTEAPASATEAKLEQVTAAPPARDWYGYQTLIVDALSCSLLVYFAASFNGDALFGA